MKVGLIRCQQTEDLCSAATCFSVMKKKKGAFEGIEEEIEVIAVNSCGGCPGKRALPRASWMVQRGAEAIVLSSCIRNGAPIGFPCPYADEIANGIRKRVGDGIKIFEYTHD